MTQKTGKISRRQFLVATASAGLAAVAAPLGRTVGAADPPQTIPMRPFGNTGVDVPILSLGGMFDIAANRILMNQAVRWGVTYWDTADCYQRGSERGIGKYFQKYPQNRKKIFLVTKSDARDPQRMTRLLDRSLEKMQTDYIDLYFAHGIYGIEELDGSTARWAEKAKAAGKIRLFGFSTHTNMEDCLLAAAKLGWIDGIMLTYNYRLMHYDRMRQAVEACAEAGIGLTAMKTQGGGSVKTDTQTELDIAGRFLQRGFSDAQAKLMAVWQDANISSICSQMPNMTILMANVAAALNRTVLSGKDAELLRRHARQTHSDYCTGCAKICESAMECRIPIADVMRYLMYACSYGDRDRAVAGFNTIPENVRLRLAALDFSRAEQECPQNMAIGKLMRQALTEFS